MPENHDDATTEAAEVTEAPETAAAAETRPAAETEEEGVRFTDLGLDGRVLAALQDVGYEKPSPI
ncbi:hypothetical protein, partial [Arthrobacter globiformis]|uniref:hypothetical protein n=1 Tax=Arthrobacter globiformis TaxID=1665 RepID=UPI001124EC13